MSELFEPEIGANKILKDLDIQESHKSTNEQVQELITKIKNLEGRRRINPIKTKIQGTQSPRKSPTRMLMKSNSFALESINLKIPSPRKRQDFGNLRNLSPTKTELLEAINDAMDAKKIIKNLQSSTLIA
jgi:hypothetical protein